MCKENLGEQIDVLLATSAMPGFYEPVKIDGHYFQDGGWTKLGNMPIEILYKVGRRKILLLSLDENFGYNKTGSFNYSSLRFFLITGEIFKIKDQQTGEKPHNYGRKSLHLNLIYGMM